MAEEMEKKVEAGEKLLNFEEILKKYKEKTLDDWTDCMQKLLEENFYEFWFTDISIFAWRDDEYVRYSCDTQHIHYFDSIDELKEALFYIDERAKILFNKEGD